MSFIVEAFEKGRQQIRRIINEHALPIEGDEHDRYWAEENAKGNPLASFNLYLAKELQTQFATAVEPERGAIFAAVSKNIKDTERDLRTKEYHAFLRTQQFPEDFSWFTPEREKDILEKDKPTVSAIAEMTGRLYEVSKFRSAAYKIEKELESRRRAGADFDEDHLKGLHHFRYFATDLADASKKIFISGDKLNTHWPLFSNTQAGYPKTEHAFANSKRDDFGICFERTYSAFSLAA